MILEENKCFSYLSERYTHGAPKSLTSAWKVCHNCCRLSGAIYNIGYWLKQEYSTTGPGIWESCEASLRTFIMLEGLDAKICWQVFFSFLFLIIKIDKNATENSTGRKIDVYASFEVKKSRNSSGNVQSLRLAMPWSRWLGSPKQFSHCFQQFHEHCVFEIVKACLGATVATCHSQ